MDTLPRQLESLCLKDLAYFPVLTLTGPRQSGKTTLLRKLLPDWTYANLEDPTLQEFARQDPQGFIASYNNQVIIDEVQRVPEILSSIQVEVDRSRLPGRFALSGSHNLLLHRHVSQSLAGRTSMRQLLPFSYAELGVQVPAELNEVLFLGGFPPVFQSRENAVPWLDSYIQTYVERDVRMIRQVADLATFQRFLRLCAYRAGQLLDLSGIGSDVGMSHNSVREWIGVLEAGLIAFRLEPYFRNFSKRVIKSPKLYFYDTGVLCRLLDIRSPSDLIHHSSRGAVFENWCVVEALKGTLYRGEKPGIYFWRDKSIEVDLIMTLGNERLAAIECKSSATPISEFIDSAVKLRQIAAGEQVIPAVVYGGEQTQHRTSGRYLSWRDFALEVATGFTQNR